MEPTSPTRPFSGSTAKRTVFCWIVGAIIGTAIIAVTSPLFVRSYLPRQLERGVWALPPGSVYRWRSEGYAETQIGPLGMPGKLTTKSGNPETTRVALWGDSQAEGVCVADVDKIFAQTENASGGSCEVFPLALSGDDADEWLRQLPDIEQKLSIEVHVFLIVELSDVLSAATQSARTTNPTPPPLNDIASALPAFVIQSVRNLLTDSDGTTFRRLRFTIGPQSSRLETPEPSMSNPESSEVADYSEAIRAIADSTNRPIVIVYAPILPQISGGREIIEDVLAGEFEHLRHQAEMNGIQVIDMREEFRAAVVRGDWPHGFHNGQIGSGHLNACGNQIIAKKIASALATLAPLGE